MNYIKIGTADELKAGNKKKITHDGKDILLANISGVYYAVDNTCPHMGGSLAEGKLDGRNIICPRHGSVFDVTSGKAVQGGKMLFMKIKVGDIHSYPVKTDGNDLLLGIE